MRLEEELAILWVWAVPCLQQQSLQELTALGELKEGGTDALGPVLYGYGHSSLWATHSSRCL